MYYQSFILSHINKEAAVNYFIQVNSLLNGSQFDLACFHYFPSVGSSLLLVLIRKLISVLFRPSPEESSHRYGRNVDSSTVFLLWQGRPTLFCYYHCWCRIQWGFKIFYMKIQFTMKCYSILRRFYKTETDSIHDFNMVS